MAQITNNRLDAQDKPITSSKDDKLDRSKIVDSIIYAIDDPNSTDHKHSLAIGIEGPWGSGKTSIINLVKNKIKNDGENDNKYVFLDFNPWMHMGTEQILVDFFRSLNESIKEILAIERPSVATDIAAQEKVEYLKSILEGTTFSFNLGIIAASKTITPNIEDESIGTKKAKLAELIGGLNKKIICIIDDIDRLDADETLLIFKLTKIIADFPNMVFLLAYDRRRTASLISKKMNAVGTFNIEDDDMGDKFIQKIVQVVRPVPYSMDNIHKKYFMSLVESARFYQSTSKVDKEVIGITYDKHLINILRTPRDIKRFVYHIDLFLKMNESSDIYIRDLLLIESFRMMAYKLHEKIKDNKEILLGKEPLYEEEVSDLMNIVVGDTRPKTFSALGSGMRTKTIADIIEIAPQYLQHNILSALISILRCEPTYHETTHTQEYFHRLLVDNWDKYFFSIPDNNTESK